MTKPLSFMKSPERDKYMICSSDLTLKNNILKSNMLADGNHGRLRAQHVVIYT